MAFIGKQPTPVPLTANDITDGIISTDKLADTSVTNAKLNADLISGETELATAPADTDEFLISDAGVLKRLDASLVGGKDFEKIVSASGTGSSGTISLTSCFTTSFDFYEIRGECFTSSDQQIKFQLLDTVGNAKTSYYYLGYNSYTNNSSESLYQFDGWSANEITISESHASSATRGAPFTFSVFNPKNTSTGTSFIYRQHTYSNNGYFRSSEVMGGYNSGEAINGIKMFMSSGNFNTSTKITVYGFKA
tara:strand:+ start:39 stop:788 length:750 start_codon:yes stop_codon:yes gene_type:complete